MLSLPSYQQELAAESVLKGRYVVIERCGEGSFSSVFHCWDVVADRQVAIKVMKAGTETERKLLCAVQREMRMLQDIASHERSIGIPMAQFTTPATQSSTSTIGLVVREKQANCSLEGSSSTPVAGSTGVCTVCPGKADQSPIGLAGQATQCSIHTVVPNGVAACDASLLSALSTSVGNQNAPTAAIVTNLGVGAMVSAAFSCSSSSSCTLRVVSAAHSTTWCGTYLCSTQGASGVASAPGVGVTPATSLLSNSLLLCGSGALTATAGPPFALLVAPAAAHPHATTLSCPSTGGGTLNAQASCSIGVVDALGNARVHMEGGEGWGTTLVVSFVPLLCSLFCCIIISSAQPRRQVTCDTAHSEHANSHSKHTS